jgi:cytochrome c553
MAASLGAGEVPMWPFPGAGATAVRTDATEKEIASVPGSEVRRARATTHDLFAPPDWFPAEHPAPPPVVARGRAPAVWACGYCHLPDGSGRPENANIAGLPADYIVRQVAAFAAGRRHNACVPDAKPMEGMRMVAAAARPEEIAAAAAYFAQVRRVGKVRVIEAATIPAVQEQAFIYDLKHDGTTEPIAGRIVEIAADMSRHELRDPHLDYVAYVPPGSIERGARLVKAGPKGPETSCFVCHGPELKGTPVAPPLAGQFPTVVVRQLLAFQSGGRAGPETVPMQTVVANLTMANMVDLAAYVASLANNEAIARSVSKP